MALKYCNNNDGGRPGCAIRTQPGVLPSAVRFLTAFLLLLGSASHAFGRTDPGTVIDNTAVARYAVDDSGPLSVASNRVTIVTVELRTPSQIELLQYAPSRQDALMISVAPTSYSTDGTAAGVFNVLPPPVPPGRVQPLDLTQPLPLTLATVYHRGDPVFMRVRDPDQNLDPGTVETVLVTLAVMPAGEVMLLRLTETAPDSGEFAGYVQSRDETAGRALDEFLAVAPDAIAAASYVDTSDPDDRAEASAPVDPRGRVFDSATGAPVDGASLTLVDMATGMPAVVFGDDGASVFPATVVSGGTVTDSGGHTYDFPPGCYRFPFLVAGNYRIDVTGPPNYDVPSRVATAELQQLPGAPFAIAEPGSRGEPFSINPGPAVHVDIPLDPLAVSDRLALTKTADKELVSHGDFLVYTLRLENRGSGLAIQTVIDDRLPPGFHYRPGSAVLAGGAAIEPRITADGRGLDFDLGDLPMLETVNITYVVEVAAGAPTGPATSVARASAEPDLRSGEAAVVAMVRDPFFREAAFITGRVVVGDCEVLPAETRAGVRGVRIYLEDGTFAVTDDEGRYHFEGVAPGAHVVQLDLASLPERHAPLACLDDSRAAGRAYSRFVDLQGGTLWRADFQLSYTPEPVPAGEMTLALATSRTGTTLSCRVEARDPVVPHRDLQLTVMLPDGMAYEDGSSTLDGLATADPEIMDNVLVYRLGDAPADSARTLRFRSRLTHLKESRDLPVRAQLGFTMPTGEIGRTDLVTTTVGLELDEMLTLKPDVVLRPRFETFSARVHPDYHRELDALADLLRTRQVLHMHVTGHSDNVPISPRGQKIFADNYVLSMARARSIGQYLGTALGLEPHQITMVGAGPDEPVASNGTREGRQLNRRVELRVVTAEKFNQASQDTVTQTRTLTLPTVGLRPSEARRAAAAAVVDTAVPPAMPVIDEAWLAGAEPDDRWVWPPAGFQPAIPSLKVAVQHHEAREVVLLLDSQPVPKTNFESVKVGPDRRVAVSLWTGIDLKEGENLLTAVGLDDQGREIWRKHRSVHYASPPSHAEILADRSLLVADGKTPPVVAVRLVDRQGQPARQGVVGGFLVDPPHAAKQEFDSFQKNPLVGMNNQNPTYVVGPGGVALIELEPTTRTGEAVVHFRFQDHQQEIRVWLEPDARDWILVGLAEGTVGYNTISGNMEAIGPDGPQDKWYSDGRLAFYAKGAIKGEWLATLAFDTGKPWSGNVARLNQEIDPDTYYTIYGDGSRQDYDASSARRLYVKIERSQFYALFGDFATGLTVNELARYSRRFNGIKSELKTPHLGLNLFASQTGHGFARDEIRGDGTSGLYYLTRQGLVINSERISIEVRDRFRSELIVSSRTLARHLDYDIDYDSGSLYFKEPIFSKDDDLNPVFIVVEYETREAGANHDNFGGRAAVTPGAGPLELGTTFIHQEQVAGKGDLLGWDGRYRFGPQTELKGEFVVTDTEAIGRREGWLGEFKNTAGRLGSRLYWRYNEAGFGLGQQNRSEAGTRKFGLDLDYRMNSVLTLRGQSYRQDNLANGARRDNVEARFQWRDAILGAHAGGRYVNDRFTDGEQRGSTQVTAGGSVSTRNRRLKFSADHEQSLGGRNANVDYPTRSTFGADFEVIRNLNLVTRYELTNGDAGDSRGARVGVETKPWTGATANSSWEQRSNENGARAFANLGLRQIWKVSSRWSLDVGLDHSRATSGALEPRPNQAVPPASGAPVGFTAVSSGVGYQAGKWRWNSRFEIRNSEIDDRWAVNPSVLVEPRSGLGLAATARILGREGTAGSRSRTTDMRLGLALRPDKQGWVILDRLDWITDDRISPTVDLSGWRIVNHLNLTYFSGRNTQIALQYGAKYNREDLAGRRFSGFTDLVGGEARQNISRRMDLGLRVGSLHSWNAKQFDYSAGASWGVNLMTNTWISLGYNVVGFYDRDFSAANFTAKGPFLRVRLKFDQETAGEILQAFMGGGHE
jgi:uncharacterized repeat protein (TIGR01451 family)